VIISPRVLWARSLFSQIGSILNMTGSAAAGGAGPFSPDADKEESGDPLRGAEEREEEDEAREARVAFDEEDNDAEVDPPVDAQTFVDEAVALSQINSMGVTLVALGRERTKTITAMNAGDVIVCPRTLSRLKSLLECIKAAAVNVRFQFIFDESDVSPMADDRYGYPNLLRDILHFDMFVEAENVYYKRVFMSWFVTATPLGTFFDTLCLMSPPKHSKWWRPLMPPGLGLRRLDYAQLREPVKYYSDEMIDFTAMAEDIDTGTYTSEEASPSRAAIWRCPARRFSRTLRSRCR
jgi:hypothetical protein